MYTAPVILNPFLSSEVYHHFLTLHVAITILCSSKLLIHLNYARQLLLKHFVICFKIIYGPQYVSYNVHGLIHLANDVELHGPLDSFSSFQFENYMQQIKKRVRKDNKPLEQIIRRHTEIEKLEQQKSVSTAINNPLLLQCHQCGPLSLDIQCHSTVK